MSRKCEWSSPGSSPETAHPGHVPTGHLGNRPHYKEGRAWARPSRLASVKRTLEQHDWPRHEVAILQRDSDRFPAFSTKLVQLLRFPRLAVFLQALRFLKGS